VLIETEMLQLELRGGGSDQLDNFFDVFVTLNPTTLTKGQITGSADNFFPAKSFFDVFFEISLGVNGGQPSPPAHNLDPVHMQATISSIPPVEVAYVPKLSTPVQLFVDGNQTPVACLVHAQHVPAEPSHVKIKREMIDLERKLDRILRAGRIP